MNTKLKGEDMEEKKKRKKGSFFWLMGVCFLAVGLLFFCQFYFGDSVNDKTTFYDNTFINGVDVSGLTKDQANTLLEAKLIEDKSKLNLTLKNGDKEWKISGNDFEIVGNFNDTLDKTLNYGRDGNVFQKKKIEAKIKKDGLSVNVPYQNLFGGIDQSLDDIISQIETSPVSSQISFEPESEVMFVSKEAQKGVVVERSQLEKQISEAISLNRDEIIEVPTKEILPDKDMNDYINKISLRSKFSTDYSKSSASRKSNIKKALSCFNGLIVEPGEEISFNEKTGARTAENGYKEAKIIFNGSYVPGVGGGVCQASTTLYNALLLADVQILEVRHHTLPASYVPLSFDAMVSEGYADLVFKNNLDLPIYIKTYGTENEAIVEIYGEPFDEGVSIKTRSELVKVIPHSGDEIITDTNGNYADKVLYKGEYYRLKYPQEGYETKGYIQYLKDDKIIEEKEIRHDKYSPQQGVIVEGNYSLEEGMNLPENSVKYIAPQKVTSQTIENARKKWNITQKMA